MKHLIFIIFLFCPFLTKAQTGHRLVYNLNYQIDSTDINSVRDEVFYLDIFGEQSYFISQDLFVKDSVFRTSSDQQLMSMMGKPEMRPKSPKNAYIIYKKENSTKHYERIVLQEFAYKEEVSLNWKLSDDTLRIANYLCQKATTHFAGRDYTAWYTIEIPLTAAPYKFTGLLGTIVRVVDSKNHYQFDLVEIKAIDKSTVVYNFIDKLKNYISKKEFWHTKNKLDENPELRYVNSPISFGGENNELMKKNSAARRKIENNPIELK